MTIRNVFTAALCGSTALVLIACSPSAPEASGGGGHGEAAAEEYERGRSQNPSHDGLGLEP